MIHWTEKNTAYLVEHYGRIHTTEIAKSLGLTQRQVVNKASSLGLKSNLTRRFKESPLQKIKSLGIVPLDPITSSASKIRFQCFCGNEFVTTVNKVARRHTKSCGCLRSKGRLGKHFSGDYFCHTKKGARRRGLQFDLTIHYLDDLLQSQGFRCALSGRPLVYGYKSDRHESQTASIDRIDSRLGYVVGNVQILHKDVNMAKQSLSQEDFVQLCKEIARYAKS